MHKINHANIKEWARNYDGPLFDGILCDPPYELGFMGKSWDSSGIAFDKDMWADLLRILKPGGHLLAFSGSRTYHRMAVAIEDAGFEIRDMIEWVYGSGFPKSLNIGKAVDKIQGNEREVTGIKEQPLMTNHYGKGLHNERPIKELEETKGTSPYEGYGTALKPAHEPCVLARKPIEGTVANNVLKHGTGGLAIDNCRIKPANATDEPSNPLLSAQRTVFSDKPELAPSSLDEIFSYSLDTLHDYFEHISSEQRAYNIVCTTPLHDVAFLKNTQNKQLLGVPCDYGQLVERVRQYENQGYEAQDFLSDYPTLHRLCDVYARQAKVPDQDVAPLLADVLAYIRSVQQESLHSPDYNSQYLLLVLVVFAYDLLRSILPYDYTTSSTQSTGRFPSNLILDGSDEVEAVFPQTKSGSKPGQKGKSLIGSENGETRTEIENAYGDSGSASRFFFTAKPDLYCSLCYGIMEVCENNAKNAQTTSQLGTQASNTAQDNVAVKQVQEPEDSKPNKTNNAHNAVNSSVSTSQTTESIAQPNVTQNLKELLDLTAKYAESQCLKCQTSIAQKLVVMATENMELQACRDFITDYKNSTQNENLVSTVAYLANIDITQTTINLMKLCGFAHHATDENTKQGSQEKDKGIYRLKYTAKASKRERNAGLEGFEEKSLKGFNASPRENHGEVRDVSLHTNHHPTVKPLSLTKYLATLIKPPTGGRLLVPFSGSGSEMIGALQAGWEYVEGVELTEEYIPIAEARIKYWLEQQEEEQTSLVFRV